MIARWAILLAAAGLVGGCAEDSGTEAPASPAGDSEVAVMAFDFYAPTITAGATRPWQGAATRYLVSTVPYPGAEWVDIVMEITLSNGYRYDLWAGRGASGDVIDCEFYFPELGFFDLKARACYWNYPGYFQSVYNSGYSNAYPVEVILQPRRPQKPQQITEP